MNVSKPAGRLLYFKKSWKSFTDDSVVLSWVQGYKIPFCKQVVQTFPVREENWSNSDLDKMEELVNQLIFKGAIEECSPLPDQFISRTFFVPKPDGSNRFIINLKELNAFIDPQHFKMEDGRTVMKLMSRNCYMASLDIKDAYYLIPVHKTYRKFLRFTFKGCLYEFTCLPFGLCTAPFVFTKLMKPIASYLRERGITLVIYLDDIWLVADSKSKCLENVKFVANTLHRLGFIINYEKSQVEPSQKCVFLGMIYDSCNMRVELPDRKKEKIQSLVKQFRVNDSCTIQKFAETLGYLVSCCPAVNYGLAHTKSCERLKFKALLESNGNYKGLITINNDVIEELHWWYSVGSISWNPIRSPRYDFVIFSDASKSGWGAVCKNQRANGFWKRSEEDYSINMLELMAAYFGLKCFASNMHDCQILLRIDNTTAIAYINRMGGVQNKGLSDLAKKIWKWCEIRKIWIYASYIKSKENNEADFESRKLESNTEFELTNYGFKKITEKLGSPDIDLFASRTNAKCKTYVSWKRDPSAFAIDAFTIPWENYFFYAFPPFSLILRVLQKIKYDGAEGILVVPYWPSQAWFPTFCSMVVSDIVYFPSNKYIVNPSNRFWEKTTLAVAILSGKVAS